MLNVDTISPNFGTINAGTSTAVITGFTGAKTTDVVVASPVPDLDNGLIIAQVRVSSADNIEIVIYNSTGGGIAVGAVDFNVALLRL